MGVYYFYKEDTVMEDTVYIEFSNKIGDILSQKPFVKWDEKLFRCIFKNYEYTQSVNNGNEWIYRDSPEYDNLYRAEHRKEFDKVAKIVSVTSSGMIIQPLPWYREFIFATADKLKLKNLLLCKAQYSDEDCCADIIYGGTWLEPDIFAVTDTGEYYRNITDIDVVYVDESIIKKDKNPIVISGRDVFNMNEYKYITSISKHISTGLINSKFPENLISKINLSKNGPAVIFPSSAIGDKNFDDLIHCTDKIKIVYLDKNKKYSILEKVYCIHSFDEVKLI